MRVFPNARRQISIIVKRETLIYSERQRYRLPKIKPVFVLNMVRHHKAADLCSAYPKVYIKNGKFYITGSTVLHN